MGVNGQLIRSLKQLQDGIDRSAGQGGKISLMIDHFQRQVDRSTPTPGGGGGGDDEGEDELDLYMPTYLRPPKNATQQATGVDDDNDSLISEDDVEENADDWWHDSLSTLEANAILSARAAEDGWFLVRGAKSKSGKDVVVLSCVFKGQPTYVRADEPSVAHTPRHATRHTHVLWCAAFR